MLTETVEIVRRSPGATDEFGDPASSETSRSTVSGRLEQTDSTEVTAGRDTALSNWRLFLAPGTTVDSTDQVVAGGRTFEVVGPPDELKTPRGAHHTVVRLRHIAG